MLTGIAVREVMRNKVASIDSQANAIECARTMARQQVGSLVIQNKGKVSGIITEQDLARKVLAKGLDPKKVKAGRVMSGRVHTIGPEEDIYHAIIKMGEQKIKHLPVTQGDKLVGIISYKDIIRVQPGLIELLSFKSSLTESEKKAIFFNR